uniref:Uncharacterized protein n=1 Tax=viral metagenome TaxID=1070528 RepID=A0A6C0JYP0_9ZZZZ
MSTADHQNYADARMGLIAAAEARDAARDAAHEQADITIMAGGDWEVSDEEYPRYEFAESKAFAALAAADEAYQRAFVVYNSAKEAYNRTVKLCIKEMFPVNLEKKLKQIAFERRIPALRAWAAGRRR